MPVAEDERVHPFSSSPMQVPHSSQQIFYFIFYYASWSRQCVSIVFAPGFKSLISYFRIQFRFIKK